jgi:hypothetical protein
LQRDRKDWGSRGKRRGKGGRKKKRTEKNQGREKKVEQERAEQIKNLTEWEKEIGSKIKI